MHIDTTTEDTEVTANTTETPDGAEPDADSADEEQEGTGNAEAARYRRRLREVEAERDALNKQITGQESALISYALSRNSIDPRLWELSEVNLDDLRDDAGHLDIAAVLNRAEQIRTDVYGRGPRPNAQQGMPGQGTATPGLAGAFDPQRGKARAL